MNGRERLPDRRGCDTRYMRVGKQEYVVTVGHYGNGSVGEIFVSGAKAGSDMEAVMRDGAILLSLALQHGVPIETMRGAITREGDGTASSIIGAVLDHLK